MRGMAGRYRRPFRQPEAWILYDSLTDSVELGFRLPRWWFVIERFPRLRLVRLVLRWLWKGPRVAHDGHAAHKRRLEDLVPWRPPYGRGPPPRVDPKPADYDDAV